MALPVANGICSTCFAASGGEIVTKAPLLTTSTGSELELRVDVARRAVLKAALDLDAPGAGRVPVMSFAGATSASGIFTSVASSSSSSSCPLYSCSRARLPVPVGPQVQVQNAGTSKTHLKPASHHWKSNSEGLHQIGKDLTRTGSSKVLVK